jgi:hypothetical protein
VAERCEAEFPPTKASFGWERSTAELLADSHEVVAFIIDLTIDDRNQGELPFGAFHFSHPRRLLSLTRVAVIVTLSAKY